MFATVLVLLAVVAAVFAAPVVEYTGEIKIQGDFPDVIKTQTNFSRFVPTAWDWRKKGLLTTDLNQHIPQYCGSCWAHASVSTIADRIKINSKGVLRDVIPSVQVLLNCGTAGSCNGGDIHAAFRWIHMNSIPDVTCQQYRAVESQTCNAIDVCMNCDPGGSPCYAIDNYPKITISEYGRVIGDVNIQKEIMNRGPVACYINSRCIEKYSGGVSLYNESDTGDACKPYLFDHAIQLNGWGVEEDGTEYWIGRNSWGTYWGERGFFRIVRGGAYDPIGCYFAVPDAIEVDF